MADYGMLATTDLDFDTAKASIVDALKEQGFGILTTIDLAGTLKEKVGTEMGRYEILGACNPKLAEQAVGAEPTIGLLLPCNVIVREVEAGTQVGILDPAEMFRLADADTQARLEPIAGDARGRLVEALEGVVG